MENQPLQQPPYAIQIELTEGCNLMCSFCGIQGIRENAGGPFNFMTLANAETIARGIGVAIAHHHWNPRIEFAMHGEPTMNPQWIELISAFRVALPNQYLMLTSNGMGFLRRGQTLLEWLRSAFTQAGLNVIALDDYQHTRIVGTIRSALGGTHPASYGAHHVYEYPAETSGNPHNRRKPNEHDLVFVQDISQAETGTHATLNNHAGCAFPMNNSAQGKPCAKPFRELSIRWDGNVAICCNDWRGTFKVGNVLATGVETVWQSSRLAMARRYLLRGERTFDPCRGCDATSYRTGLLPDTLGKQRASYPLPDEASRRVVTEATEGDPYAPIVLRPWEK